MRVQLADVKIPSVQILNIIVGLLPADKDDNNRRVDKGQIALIALDDNRQARNHPKILHERVVFLLQEDQPVFVEEHQAG